MYIMKLYVTMNCCYEHENNRTGGSAQGMEKEDERRGYSNKGIHVSRLWLQMLNIENRPLRHSEIRKACYLSHFR